MPLGNWSVEFLNQNSQRAYPLADEASCQDITGTITIPRSFLLALYFPVTAAVDVDPANFYISTLAITSTGFVIGISYNDDSDDPPLVTSVNITAATHVENHSYSMAGINDFDDSTGKVVIGPLDEISLLPAGQYTFSPAAGQLDSDCIWPELRGIPAIVLVNGQERSAKIFGDVEFVAGSNFRLVAQLISGQKPQIIFNAIDGEGLTEDCTCDENATAPAIRTINGVAPDINGNIDVIGSTCVDIEPGQNLLTINDSCNTPCCGCPQLDAIVSQIQRLDSGVFTLQNYVTQLSVQASTFNSTVLASKLNDTGCSHV